MTMVNGFVDLPDVVLGPLAGRPESDWQRAPAGKWTPAQIVEHLNIALDYSARTFAERRAKPPMRRRPRTPGEWALGLLIIDIGWFPPGRRAPPASRPPDHVDPGPAEAKFRKAHALLVELGRALLPGRRRDLFVRHIVFGDLTLEEWLRFHVVHCRHHAKQIHARL